MKGIGKEKEGLYQLSSITKRLSPVSTHVYSSCSTSTSAPSQFAASPQDHFSIWHLKFSHAPFEVLQRIQVLKPSIHTDKSMFCPICPLARQTKFPFPSSNKRVILPFVLLHMDVRVHTNNVLIMVTSTFSLL